MFNKKDSTAIKGIAIIIMMWHHCFLAGRFEDYNVIFTPLSVSMATDLARYLKICVSMFCFVSGYGLYLSLDQYDSKAKGYRSWINARLIKTMAGYWFVMVLSWIICFLINRRTYTFYFSEATPLKGAFFMVLDALGVSGIFGREFFCGTWWYMGAAILFIITAPILYEILNKYGMALILVICMALPRLIGVNDITNLNSFFLAFCIGMWLSKVKAFDYFCTTAFYQKNRPAAQVLEFILILLSLVLSCLLFLELPLTIYWDVLRGILPLPFLFFSVKYVIRIPVIRTILLFLGKHSMNIFLIHTFFRVYYASDFIYSLRYAYLIIAVLLGISVIASIITEFLKNVTGYNRFISSLVRKIS